MPTIPSHRGTRNQRRRGSILRGTMPKAQLLSEPHLILPKVKHSHDVLQKWNANNVQCDTTQGDLCRRSQIRHTNPLSSLIDQIRTIMVERLVTERDTEFRCFGRAINNIQTEVRVISCRRWKKSVDRLNDCLLYTSDAADDMQCVDLGCRRIIKKKKKKNEFFFFKQKTAYFFFSSRRRHTR